MPTDLERASRRLLVLGCGRAQCRPDADWDEVVNHDLVALPGVDVAHDLRHYPWPWPDEHFGSVIAYDVLEHLPDLIGAMEELHRVLVLKRVNGDPGLAVIKVPLAGSLHHQTDPTHVRGFTEWSFDYFIEEEDFCKHNRHYSTARFGLWKIEIERGDGAREDGESAFELIERPLPPVWADRMRAREPGFNLRFHLSKRPRDERVVAWRRQSGLLAPVHTYAQTFRPPGFGH